MKKQLYSCLIIAIVLLCSCQKQYAVKIVTRHAITGAPVPNIDWNIVNGEHSEFSIGHGSTDNAGESISYFDARPGTYLKITVFSASPAFSPSSWTGDARDLPEILEFKGQ